jgi:hypothetical protein
MERSRREDTHATLASTIPTVNRTLRFQTVGVACGSTLSYPMAIKVPEIAVTITNAIRHLYRPRNKNNQNDT